MYNDSGPTGRLAADCRRYSGGTIFRVIPFNPTGYTSNVAGGRLPMELWCDCPRQSKNLIRCAKHRPYDSFVTNTVYLMCISMFCDRTFKSIHRI